MRPFKYTRASNERAAVQAAAANPRAKFLAGGTNLLDLMKENVERPSELVDLTRLKLSEIKSAGGGVSIGALASNQVFFNMQPIALVLAETYEQARYAARLVKATYNEEKPTTDLESSLDKAVAIDPRGAVVPRGAVRPRGNPTQAFQSAPVKVEAEYTIPIEHHNPMELHGAIAFWEGNRLTIFDKTQGVYVVRRHLATSFNIPEENILV